MPFIKYTREELTQVISIFKDSDYFFPYHEYWDPADKAEEVKKLEDLIKVEKDCQDPKVTELDLNKSMWRILGQGIGLYLFIVVPLKRIPLLINTYKGTPEDIIIKIRLQIGK
jgi:hypothetical protein